jgi:serine/threonine protein kinase
MAQHLFPAAAGSPLRLVRDVDAGIETGDRRPGDLIAEQYRLSEKMGEGAMSAVWVARDEKIDRPVAVKLLPGNRQISPLERSYLTSRLVRETRITEAIDHPAIVRAIDWGFEASNDPFLVLELLIGQSFDHLFERGRGLPPECAVQLLLPIADGLSAAHACDVVHRDVKPQNLFLAWKAHGKVQPKLIDFGVAKVVEPASKKRLTGGAVIGTPEYMAPEQVIDASSVDCRADVWSYCVVLYELVSGVVPFPGRSHADVLRRVLGGEASPLVTQVGFDPALWAVIERGLRKDPEDRWASMQQLRKALAAWLVSRSAPQEIPPETFATRRSRSSA